jgi:hypothetical protein
MNIWKIVGERRHRPRHMADELEDPHPPKKTPDKIQPEKIRSQRRACGLVERAKVATVVAIASGTSSGK